MQFLEEHEKGQRKWYAGSVGLVGFDGNMNTGLTLRTVHIQRGVATVRAGATLLYHSNPDEEEEETRIKASAFISALRNSTVTRETVPESPSKSQEFENVHMLMIDHQDSFVHTIANYIRQTGVDLTTLRAIPHQPSNGITEACLDGINFMFLSPGPGSPTNFKLSHTIQLAIDNNIPIFGVCLGLQGIVEHFGGDLGVLNLPMHGKSSEVTCTTPGVSLFDGIPEKFTAARYHSLYAKRETLPECLEVLAQTSDGTIMAVRHKTYPIAAIQFHPESILTPNEIGLQILVNALKVLRKEMYSD